MKRLFCIIAMVLMLTGIAIAQEWTKGSGAKTASALIYTGEGYFHGILVATDGTNAITLNVYDAVTATGTKLIPTTIVTTSSVDRIQAIKPPGGPVHFRTGLYIDTTCAGTTGYVVYFK